MKKTKSKRNADFVAERMELARRISLHEAPIQVPVGPEAAKRQLIGRSLVLLLKACDNP
jgi:hypothetical protein